MAVTQDTAKRQGQHKGDNSSRIETVIGITVMITVDFSTMNNQESSNPIQVEGLREAENTMRNTKQLQSPNHIIGSAGWTQKRSSRLLRLKEARKRERYTGLVTDLVHQSLKTNI
jgi:hypothetical protein